MSISKRLRFLVFRRDNYTCTYCGSKAPKVRLEPDHKLPICQGGKDTLENLATACFDCNRGKGPLRHQEGPMLGPSFDYRDIEYGPVPFDFSRPDWSEDLEPNEFRESREFFGKPSFIFKFDVYQAMSEVAPASQQLRYTLDAILQKAEAF